MTRRDWFITALAPMLWGTMPVVATHALPPNRPLLAGTTRAMVAGLAFMLVFRKLPERAWTGRIVTMGTLNIAGAFGLFFVAASRLPGGIIAILMALSPFWAALLGWPLLRQKPKALQLALILLGVVGVSLLVGASAARLDPIGIAAGLAASTSMASGMVLTKRWGRPAPLPVFTGWQLFVGGVLLTTLMVSTEGLPPSLTGRHVLALLWLVVACTAIPYLLWFRGIERLGAQRTSTLLLIVPVVAFSIDVIALHKSLTALQTFGALIVVGCLSADGFLSARASRAAS